MQIRFRRKDIALDPYEKWCRLNRLTDTRLRYLARAKQYSFSILSKNPVKQIYPYDYEVCKEKPRNEWICFLHEGDRLEETALSELSLAIEYHPGARIFYSDEDRIVSGKYTKPFFKPDYSPELLLSCPYMDGLLCIHKDLYEEIFPWEILLKHSQKVSVVHIPTVLYHRDKWQTIDDTFLKSYWNNQPILFNRSNDYLPIFKPIFTDEGPCVTIVIPCRDSDHLNRNLRSLQKTTYKNYEILIVGQGKEGLNCIEFPYDNLACLCKEGARVAKTEFIVFLASDTEIISPRWLSSMMGYLQLSDVGVVGLKIISPDYFVKNTGFVYDERGVRSEKNNLDISRNCSAVSGVCLLTKRDLFLNYGYDEKLFPNEFHDIDYCLRLKDLGYRTVYCSDVSLIHQGLTYKKERIHYRGNHKDPYCNENLIAYKSHSYPNMDKIDVVIFLHDLGCGEVQFTLLNMIDDFKDDFNLTLLAFFGGLLEKDFRERGVEVIIGNKLDKCAVCWVHGILGFKIVETAWKMGIPVIWNIYEIDPTPELIKRGYKVDRRILNILEMPYRVIFSSWEMQEAYTSLNKENNFTTIIPYCNINRKKCREELGIGEDTIIIFPLGDEESKLSSLNDLEAMPIKKFEKVRCFLSEMGEKVEKWIRSRPNYIRKNINLSDRSKLNIYYGASSWQDQDILSTSYNQYKDILKEASLIS